MSNYTHTADVIKAKTPRAYANDLKAEWPYGSLTEVADDATTEAVDDYRSTVVAILDRMAEHELTPRTVATTSMLPLDRVTAIINGEVWAFGVELTRMLGALNLKSTIHEA